MAEPAAADAATGATDSQRQCRRRSLAGVVAPQRQEARPVEGAVPLICDFSQRASVRNKTTNISLLSRSIGQRVRCLILILIY